MNSPRLDASYAVVRRTGVPTGWTEKRVSEVVRIVGGGTPDRSESSYWRDGSIPWITPTDLTANDGKYIRTGAEHISENGLTNSNATLVPVGSIIFSTRGTVGNLAIAGVPLTVNQSCEVLVPDDEQVCSEFLYYLLKYGIFAFHRLAGGTTFGAITRQEIGRVHLAMPEKGEQAAIVRILDGVDVALERTRRTVEEAKQLKRAVIQSFFYKALGETAYADRPAKAPLPGWSLLPMRSLLAIDPKNGVSPTTYSQPPGIPTFSIAAIRDGRIDLVKKDNLKYADLPVKVADKFRLGLGDVLIVRGNANVDLVGKAGVVAEMPDGCIYPDITMRVVFRREGEKTVTPEFAVLAWNHPIVHNQVLRRAKTSNGTLKINSRDVSQIVMPVPPPNEQRSLVEAASAADATIDALTRKLCGYEQLKRALMHDLLTGTVRIDTALLKETTAS
jgi:type I restriction enzyme, S subunit